MGGDRGLVEDRVLLFSPSSSPLFWVIFWDEVFGTQSLFKLLITRHSTPASFAQGFSLSCIFFLFLFSSNSPLMLRPAPT